MKDKTTIYPADQTGLARAAEIIARGGVIAFPTDTVYGLGCDMFNADAVERIYTIKGRPASLPLIAMFAEVEQWPLVAASLPESAREYMQRWWPGPLTIIVPARADIPVRVLGGGSSIGMRIPDLVVTRQLLRLTDRPLATTSANRSGQPAATTARQVAAQLGDTVDLILDGGISPQGMASTVVDCTINPPAILREGPLTREMLGIPV